MKLIENTEIDIALPGPKFRLDVPDHEIMVYIPDQAVSFDLAVGHGAGNLDQITDFDRMPSEDCAASGRRQRCSGCPGVRPTITRKIGGYFEGGLAVSKHHGMDMVELIEFACFHELTKQAGAAPGDITFDALRDAGLAGGDVEPKQVTGVLEIYLYSCAHGV